MTRTFEFKSVFAPYIQQMIEVRHSQGYIFEEQAYQLSRFDKYCVQKNITESNVTRALFESWAARLPDEGSTAHYDRVRELRSFCIFMNTLGFQFWFPHVLPKPSKNIPYLMDDSDICAFFEVLDKRTPISTYPGPQRVNVEYKVIFRLIICCGLRNSEAAELKTDDVNLSNGTFKVIHSKGDKDRIVYMAEDVRILCGQYYQWLVKTLGYTPIWFFPGIRPDKHIHKSTLCTVFSETWKQTDNSRCCDKKPTVHGMRHFFVIKRMHTWIREERSLNVMMPYLSSYLGHGEPSDTFYYYHQLEEIFGEIHKKDQISAQLIPEVKHYE